MQQVIIKTTEAGQRFDKFLKKYLPEASGSFLYKMLRKKNIILNEKKADGSEKLTAGDTVSFFFSEETFEKFRGNTGKTTSQADTLILQAKKAYEKYGMLQVLYENEHILLVNKPAGMLSQKAKPADISLNEWLIGYLLHKGAVTPESLRMNRPSVCNRLDRNTSGIVICGKTLYGSQQMGAVLKDRSLHKYYLLYVEGKMEKEQRLEGYLLKDESENQVKIFDTMQPGCSKIITFYRPLAVYGEETLVEVELITGKTHQIRAHLASIGYPLVGDPKYGKEALNRRRRAQGIQHQLLHAYKVRFPRLTGELSELSECEIKAPLPRLFKQIKE